MRTAFGKTFDVPVGYLATSSIGVPPTDAAAAVTEAVARWAAGDTVAPQYDEQIEIARAAWARLVGVRPSDVAFGSTVSQLVGLVAASVPDGSRVLVVENELTSVTYPFVAQERRGVTVVEVPQAELVSTVEPGDIVAVSVVQSADGTIADLDGLRRSGAKILLDVTQAAGWLPLSLPWAHWVVGTGYKWLMTPRGVAWLAVREDVRDDVVPQAANWYAGEDRWGASGYGLPMRLVSDASRFDLSPSWFPQVGAAAVLPWLADLDMAAVRAHCVGLADGLLDRFGLPPRGSAIVSLEHPGGLTLLDAAGVRANERVGGVRLTFHLYNTEADVDLVCSALGQA